MLRQNYEKTFLKKLILNNNYHFKDVLANRTFQVRDTMAAPSRPNNPNETGGWEPVVSRKTRQRQNRKEKERAKELRSFALERERKRLERREKARKDPLQHDRNKPFSKETLRWCSKRTEFPIKLLPAVTLKDNSTDGASKDCETNPDLKIHHVHVDNGEYKLQEFVLKNPTDDESKCLEEWIVALNKGGIVMDSNPTYRVNKIINHAIRLRGFPSLIFW